MTAQVPDSLLFEGERWRLLSEPLGPYLAQLEAPPRFIAPHTALWRGYTAAWTIDDDMLYLSDVTAHVADGARLSEVGWDFLFPHVRPPLAATWYSGPLRAGRGDVVSYVHMGYESRHEHEIFLTVEQGRVLHVLRPPPPPDDGAGSKRFFRRRKTS